MKCGEGLEVDSMREMVQARLGELQREYEQGRARLRELERQQRHLEDQLLRVSGAVQVLEEILARVGDADGNGHGAEPASALAESG
jgi:predicted nuclease with TOPRIM domain